MGLREGTRWLPPLAMLAVISPAKTLDYKRVLPALGSTSPRFEEEAGKLAQSAAKLSKKKLGELMHISPALAGLNADRFRTFEALTKRPTIYAFAGDVYTGFEVHSLEPEAVRFAQEHLRILSGLYGLLRPLDEIRPYRMEMGTRWAPGRKADLYGFWGARIAEALLEDLQGSGEPVIINLASKEYWQAAERHLPAGTRVIEIDFREQGPDGLRFNTFAAKHARGMMARYICEHHLTEPEALKSFDSDGYRFERSASDEYRWSFRRA